MADSDPEDGLPNRFSNGNPELDTQRIVFDVSDLAVGPLFPPPQPDITEGNSVESFKRQLFADEDSYFDDNESYTAATTANEITMGSSHVYNKDSKPSARGGNTKTTKQQQQERRRRAPRFSYSKKLLFAPMSFYLDLNPAFSDPPESAPQELLGQIVACPNKKNNHQFEIAWIRPRSGGALHWPVNLSNHLRRYFHKNDYESQILSLINACNLNLQSEYQNKTLHCQLPAPPLVLHLQPASPAPPQQLLPEVPAQEQPLLPEAPLPSPAAVEAPPSVVAIPALVRRPSTLGAAEAAPAPLPAGGNNNQETPATAPPATAPPARLQTPAVDTTWTTTAGSAFAALHTAASRTSISSLGNSAPSRQNVDEDFLFPNPQQQQRARASRRRRTRHGNEDEEVDEVDSDQSDTDQEDQYEVDFTQNFWQSRHERQSMIEEQGDIRFVDGGDDDSIHEVVLASCPLDAPQEDYARLLRDCNEFRFTELTPLESATMPPPQKIYEGESGLRRGVWKQFETPFEAFRQAGFTQELVAHWTKNSNK